MKVTITFNGGIRPIVRNVSTPEALLRTAKGHALLANISEGRTVAVTIDEIRSDEGEVLWKDGEWLVDSPVYKRIFAY